MNNENETKTKDKTHVLDLAVRYRNEDQASNGNITHPVIAAVLAGVDANLDVQTLQTSVRPKVSFWTPLFAPTSLQSGAVVGNTALCLQDVAVKSWDAHNVGVLQKHLAKYPTSVPNLTPRYVTSAVSKLVKTEVWANLPSSSSKTGEAVISAYRPFQADLVTGMTNQNLQFLAMDADKTVNQKMWNPTAWLMNMVTYYLSRRAEIEFSQRDVECWAVGDELSIAAASNRVIYSPVIDHLTYEVEELVAATAVDKAVSLGYMPLHDAAFPQIWTGDVAQCSTATGFGKLFHSIEVPVGAGLEATPCVYGDITMDVNLVFTTDVATTVAFNNAYAEYPKVIIPPAFLSDTAIAQDRPKRMAMWLLSQLPCMATVVASVIETSEAGSEAEGLMIWNGSTIRSLLPRNLLVIVPTDVFQNVVAANTRTLVDIRYGTHSVFCPRTVGVGPAQIAAGAAILADQNIFVGNNPTAVASMSAYIATWIHDIKLHEWKWMISWVRKHYHCEDCLVDAVERIESQLGNLDVGAIMDDLDLYPAVKSIGRYQKLCEDREGNAVNYDMPMHQVRTGCDYVIRTRAGPRVHLIPAFYGELASLIVMGFYTLENKQTVIKLPEMYFSNDVDHHSMAGWNVFAKSVIYDAVFTAVGAPEATILRSKRSRFSRLAINGPTAMDTAMRLLQDQFKVLGDKLWTYTEDGGSVYGWQYKLFSKLAKTYVKYVGADLPCEAHLLEPEPAVPGTVAVPQVGAPDDYGQLDWFVSGGPQTAPGVPAWSSTAAAPYPNAKYWRLLQPDYSIVFGYQEVAYQAATGAHTLHAASLSLKGCWSWYVHQFLGLPVPKWDSSLKGSALPWSVPEEITAENDSVVPVRWMPVANYATGTKVTNGSLLDETVGPYVQERDFNIMWQIDEFTAFELRMLHVDHPVFALLGQVAERAPIASVCVPGVSAGYIPALDDNYLDALRNLTANRMNRYTEDLRWLYFYSSDAQTRRLWDDMQVHVGRNQPLAYIYANTPPVAMTIRGRSAMVMDVDSLGVLSAEELAAAAPKAGVTRETAQAPVVRPVIVDSQDRTIEGSSTLETSTSAINASSE